MRIGMLTGGGDCPGLNAVIRAVVRRGVVDHGHEIVGYRHGWRGVVEGESIPLPLEATRGLLPRGGTILGTSRTNPYKADDGPARVLATLAADGVSAIIAIGGEDTLGVADRLSRDGVNVVGVPKTIDNDLSATDFTFGFHTAVQIATDAIDRLHTTAESHDRVMVVEVMGRHAGWIATYSGLAGGADAILVPEKPFDIEELCGRLTHRHTLGANSSIVVVAEGATPVMGTTALQSGEVDEFGHVRLGGVGQLAAGGDRAAHRLRSAHDRARPRAARRNPERVRPGDRDPLRRRGDRRGPRGRLRQDGRVARNRRGAGADRRRRGRAQDRRPTPLRHRRRSSSAESWLARTQ